jgi:hypothetical protein
MREDGIKTPSGDVTADSPRAGHLSGSGGRREPMTARRAGTQKVEGGASARMTVMKRDPGGDTKVKRGTHHQTPFEGAPGGNGPPQGTNPWR